ncbi:MAG TPA: DegQ family serine endoprotease [Hyphomicrobiaceae bacterium]|nr:DegQ family serine endoprotease [Hyphomicrobiaceae bacterium]
MQNRTVAGQNRVWLGLLLVLFLALSAPALARAPLVLDEERGVLTLAPLLERTTPAVVSIAVQSRSPAADNPLLRDPFFRRFFGLPDSLPERQVVSAGSGVIVDAAKGLVLTNHHVVRNAERVTVTVKDGRQFAARIVGSDEATDIALIEVSGASGLSELALGDSDKLKVGDVVLAIGNPFGLGQTVTSGIVSALGRTGLSADHYEDFIQTDAPINPGNSGGALINSKGELMGINTAIIAPAGGNVGIGFAVPSNMARAVMEQLVKHGEVRRGRIGISVQTLTHELAKALGAPVERGAVISAVERNSPAETAGLKAGDVILSIEGKQVGDANDVRNRIGLMERGREVKLTYYRAGRTATTTVKVGAPRAQAVEGASAIPQLEGARFADIPADHPARGSVEGVLVIQVEAGSPAWRLGLRSGDIVIGVNQRPIKSAGDFEKVVRGHRGVLALNVLRGDTQLFIVAQG